MATVTRKMASLAGGQAEIEIDYDDVTLYLLTVRCINDTSSPVYLKAIRTSDGLTYDHTFPGSQTSEVNIPTGQAARLELTLLPNGKLDGVDYRIWQ